MVIGLIDDINSLMIIAERTSGSVLVKAGIFSQAALTDPNRRAIHDTHQGLRKVNKCVNKPDFIC